MSRMPRKSTERHQSSYCAPIANPCGPISIVYCTRIPQTVLIADGAWASAAVIRVVAQQLSLCLHVCCGVRYRCGVRECTGSALDGHGGLPGETISPAAATTAAFEETVAASNVLGSAGISCSVSHVQVVKLTCVAGASSFANVDHAPLFLNMLEEIGDGVSLPAVQY